MKVLPCCHALWAEFGVSRRHANFLETKIQCDLCTGSSLQVSWCSFSPSRVSRVPSKRKKEITVPWNTGETSRQGKINIEKSVALEARVRKSARTLNACQFSKLIKFTTEHTFRLCNCLFYFPCEMFFKLKIGQPGTWFWEKFLSFAATSNSLEAKNELFWTILRHFDLIVLFLSRTAMAWSFR